MIFVVGGRGQGKTTKVIQWFIDGSLIPGTDWWSRAIITIHTPEAQRLQQAVTAYAKQAKIAAPQLRAMSRNIITMGWSTPYFRGAPRGVEYVIDNFDMMLHDMFGLHKLPEFMTTTEDVYIDALA